MDMQFHVSGAAELHSALQALPLRVEKAALRGMIRAASKPVIDAARAAAPRLKDEDPRRFPGALAASIRAMSTAVRNGVVKGGVIAGGVGKVREEYGRFSARAFYARFVEYGTHKMAARPFMRPAAASETQAAIGAAAAYLRERLEAGELTR